MATRSDNHALINTAPPPRTVIEPDQGLFNLELRSLWGYRDLILLLTWREISVRYKQTAIGIIWVVLQPLVTLLIFSLVFSVVLKVKVGDYPYMAYVGPALLIWMLFAASITRGSGSLVANSTLITKVYFPRLIIPTVSVIAPTVDFMVALPFMLAVVLISGVALKWTIVFVPLFVLLTLIVALSISLWLSALNVRYRDVSQTIPFLVQIWMYLSPIIYTIDLVPVRWRPLYGLNPMASVVEGVRWALLGTPGPDVGIVAINVVMFGTLLLGGIIYFKRMERTFADVI